MTGLQILVLGLGGWLVMVFGGFIVAHLISRAIDRHAARNLEHGDPTATVIALRDYQPAWPPARPYDGGEAA